MPPLPLLCLYFLLIHTVSSRFLHRSLQPPHTARGHIRLRDLGSIRTLCSDAFSPHPPSTVRKPLTHPALPFSDRPLIERPSTAWVQTHSSRHQVELAAREVLQLSADKLEHAIATGGVAGSGAQAVAALARMKRALAEPPPSEPVREPVDRRALFPNPRVERVGAFRHADLWIDTSFRAAAAKEQRAMVRCLHLSGAC